VNPLKIPARTRLHDCGATENDLVALFKRQALNVVPDAFPRRLRMLNLGMHSPTELRITRETITSFGRDAPLVRASLGCQLLGRTNIVELDVAWDPLSSDPIIGYSALSRLCNWPDPYIRPEGSNLYETQATDGVLYHWRSLGLVPLNLDGFAILCRVIDDRDDLGEQSGLDMSVPTSVVQAIRCDHRSRQQGDLTEMFFGATLDDYSVHQDPTTQHQPLPLSRSCDDWGTPTTGYRISEGHRRASLLPKQHTDASWLADRNTSH